MEAAAAPSPPPGTPRPFLSFCLILILILIPGSLCHPSAPPRRLPPVTVTAASAPPVPTNASSLPPPAPSPTWPPTAAPPCGSSLQVSPGPTSLEGSEGQELSLQCRYRARGSAKVTWYRLCPPGRGCGGPEVPLGQGQAGGRLGGEEGLGSITFLSLSRDHAGLYFCRVEADGEQGRSCGTFLRVRAPPAAAFLPLQDRTKTQLICAQGALLLLSAAGPGLLLLLRKRLARERLQGRKGPSEGENLYEGLHLDSCSMYEDISGAFQVTYQDVGTPPEPPETPLEKP